MIKRLLVSISIILLIIALWLQRYGDYTLFMIDGEPLLLSGSLLVGAIGFLILTIIIGVMSSCG